MSHLTQMVGLDGAELRVGRGRHGRRHRAGPRPDPRPPGHDRQLLGRPRPRRHPCPVPDLPRRSASCSSAPAWCRTSTATRRRDDRRRAPRRRSPAGRSPARRPSSSSAPTVAASTTPTRSTRSRTPTASPTSCRSSLLLVIPFALCFAFGRMAKDRNAGLRRVRGDVRAVARRGSDRHERRDERQPEPHQRGGRPVGHRDPAGRLDGGQGDAVRAGHLRPRSRASTTGTSTGAVELHARLDDAASAAASPLANMMLGEVSPGGVGSGPVRHVDLRPHRGLHRRADGRAHAGVPRQTDPGERGEAGRALHPVRAAGRARLRRRVAC